jgi:hypothetical protein
MFVLLAKEEVCGGSPQVFYSKDAPDELTGAGHLATVFTLEVVDGKPVFIPKLPAGDWRVWGVDYRLI